MYRILICAVLAYFGGFHAASADQSEPLQWKNLNLVNFTAKHNWEIVKAHTQSMGQLAKLLSKPIKRDITLEETIFTLYTRNGPAKGSRVIPGEVSGLTEGGFNPTKPVVFATHGFMSGGTVDWMINMKTAQLHQLDCNFFTIDWSECADNILYPEARSCTKTVGTYLSQVVDFLGQQGASIDGMHLMGHSLGAHLVAQVSQHGHVVARITGWDPAGPLFDADDLGGRIDPSDAKVVDIIHTNCFMFGYDGLLGDYDFFPNGGDDQPGCFALDYLCDHSMSYLYYIQSLYYPEKYQATQCTSLATAKDGECTGPTTNYMGLLSVEGVKGIYYLKVNEPATGDPANHEGGYL